MINDIVFYEFKLSSMSESILTKDINIFSFEPVRKNIHVEDILNSKQYEKYTNIHRFLNLFDLETNDLFEYLYKSRLIKQRTNMFIIKKSNINELAKYLDMKTETLVHHIHNLYRKKYSYMRRRNIC